MTPISTAPIKASSRQAITLVETVVVSAIMVGILIGVYMILVRGLQFYRLNATINDRQRAVLFALARLNTEIQDSSPDLIFVDPPSAGGADPQVHSPSRGLSYAMALNDLGQAEYDASLKLYWQANGCFFLRNDGEFRWVRQNLPGGRTTSPLTPDLAGVTPASLIGGQSGKLLAQDISKFSVNVRRTNEAGQTLDRPVYEFVIECGLKDDPSGYWLELRSSTFPRN